MFLPLRLQLSVQSFGSPLLARRGLAAGGALGGVAGDRSLLDGWGLLLSVGLLAIATLVAGAGLWLLFPVVGGGDLVRSFGFGAGVLAFSLAFVASLRPEWSPQLKGPGSI